MENIDLFAPLKQNFADLDTSLPPSSYWRDAWHRLNAHRLAMIGLSIFIVIAIMAVIGPFLTQHTYYDVQLDLKNQPPDKVFWFGTDELGRDFFVRCWWGARISLFVGITVALIDLIIGVCYGSIAGFFGGKIDECMMRVADILYSIPYFLVVILLIVLMGAGMTTIILALTFTGWINMSRIVRSQVLQLKQQDFIKAAYALGASRKRILFRHLIPNAMGPIIVTLTFTIPIAIFTEAFLSFLGLGIQAPIASWGTIASDGLAALRFYPWRLFIPAALIFVTMLSLNLLGDGLRDVLDPRLRR
jgi:oligopeptide transport system permease protein